MATFNWNDAQIKLMDPEEKDVVFARGFGAIIGAASGTISASAAEINKALENFDPTDPGQMLKIQQAMANYNLCLSVTASMIKSFEDTVKSVAQKI